MLEFIPETVYKVARHYSKNKQTIPVSYIKLYMYQLFRSLAYIHSLGICHRDIKPQNLLLDTATGVLKLCDFGSAKHLVRGEPNVSYICSRYYRAPELIFGAIDYTTKIGKWSGRPQRFYVWNLIKYLLCFSFRCLECWLCFGWALARTTNFPWWFWGWPVGRNYQSSGHTHPRADPGNESQLHWVPIPTDHCPPMDKGKSKRFCSYSPLPKPTQLDLSTEPRNSYKKCHQILATPFGRRDRDSE